MQTRPITPNEITNYVLVAAILLCALVSALAFAGYGHINVKQYVAQNVYINGHPVSGNSIKVRPGTYRITVETSRYATYEVLVSVGLFKTSLVTPAFGEHSPDNIVSSVIGAYGQYGPPEIPDAKWFFNNTWLAGVLGPGDAAPIALHFTSKGWEVDYYDVPGYPRNPSHLPVAIQDYLVSENKVSLQ